MKDLYETIQEELDHLKKEGLYKEEKFLISPQDGSVSTEEKKDLINLCSNNYLGLSNHPDIIKTAKDALDLYGFGMSSVRFICGTHALHKELEAVTASYVQKEDAIVFPSCFDANGGIFEALLGKEDAIFSDQLNHASIIDGIRLCKAERFRYRHRNMQDLEDLLKKAHYARRKIIVTDGVFSMDGSIAPLKEIVYLAKKYDSLVMVDDCHATGILGEHGRGTHEKEEVLKEVDLITGTYGKALGGASGGFIAGKKECISLLRQKARPYLFSNAITPSIAAASICAVNKSKNEPERRKRLWDNAAFFRASLSKLGLDVMPGTHPIIPAIFPSANIALDVANQLYNFGVYAVAFSYPVVPKESPRIRFQMSAAHTKAQLETAISALERALEQVGILR